MRESVRRAPLLGEVYVAYIKNYFLISQRSKLLEFWGVFYISLYPVSLFVLTLFCPKDNPTVIFFLIATSVYGVFVTIPLCRRLHDTGRPQTNILWILLPIIGWAILIAYLSEDSRPGTNKYGMSDKYPQFLIDELNLAGQENAEDIKYNISISLKRKRNDHLKKMLIKHNKRLFKIFIKINTIILPLFLLLTLFNSYTLNMLMGSAFLILNAVFCMLAVANNQKIRIAAEDNILLAKNALKKNKNIFYPDLLPPPCALWEKPRIK